MGTNINRETQADEANHEIPNPEFVSERGMG